MTVSYLDLHVHSKYSFDSILKPEKIIETAKRKDLDGVAITDHGTIQGGVSAQKYNIDDFIIITGAEIRTEIGDVIGLFLNEEIKFSEIWGVIDEIHDQGGLVVLPHPSRGHDLNKLNKKLFNKIDAIEVYNARTDTKGNIQARKIAERYGFPAVAGSDAHFAGEIGLAKTIVPNNISSEDDVRRAILKHNISVVGERAPFYFRGASRILTDIKTGNLHKLPHTLLKMSIKGAKISLNKINDGKKCPLNQV